MTDEQFQQLIDLLGKVGNAAYELAVRQAQIEAVSSVVGFLVCALFAIVGYRMFSAGKKRYSESSYDIFPMFGMALGGLSMVCGVIFGADYVTRVIHYGLNPQWAALVKLSELVR